MTHKKLLDILFGVVLAAVFTFIGALAVPQGPMTTTRLAQVR
jgi:hypothetical protein